VNPAGENDKSGGETPPLFVLPSLILYLQTGAPSGEEAVAGAVGVTAPM
jgi:hypothetical protein